MEYHLLISITRFYYKSRAKQNKTNKNLGKFIFKALCLVLDNQLVSPFLVETVFPSVSTPILLSACICPQRAI